jgi:hypothetical protein
MALPINRGAPIKQTVFDETRDADIVLALSEAIKGLPIPIINIDTKPLDVSIKTIVDEIRKLPEPQPIKKCQQVEWYFEIKRDSSKLITEVIARPVPKDI